MKESDRSGRPEANPDGEEQKGRPKLKNVKSFEIDKRLLVGAWEKVRANNGAPGVDAVGINVFQEQLRDNLYKLWNRISSGSYFPGPVRAVEIPKDHGTEVRLLGVPNTVDRVAQTAAAMLLEEKLEPIFHPDSYGYRPGRSAQEAVAACRRWCWEKDWVVDCDILAFFDSVPHDLLLKAVAHHTDERWILLYVERWLKAPVQMIDGTIVAREKGTPQGSPISPVLANLFMHYAFDQWMDREHPICPFERYADDIVIHCDSEDQARTLRASVADRLESVGLELHPEKSRIVFCKDSNRPGEAEHVSFDFLGFSFRGRLLKGKYGHFIGFVPAISTKARKAIGQKIRAWHLNRRSWADLSSLAEDINPKVRGWINYYGVFYRSELRFLAWRINDHLVRWAMQKFKRLRGRYARAFDWLVRVHHHQPALFAHWQLAPPLRGRPVGAG